MALHRGYLSPVKFERIERQLDKAVLYLVRPMEKDLTLGDARRVRLFKGPCCLPALSLVHLALNKVPVACPLANFWPK